MEADTVMLDVWEQTRLRTPAEKPLALLEAVATATGDDPRTWPLGIRDRRLLELRLQWLGPHVELRIDCPNCTEALELTVDGRELLSTYADPGSFGETLPAEVSLGDLTVRLRPVTGGDLVRAGHAPDAAEAELRLLEACVLEARRDDEPVPMAALTDEDRTALADALKELDPHAEILLDLSCAACGHAFREPFDVASCVIEEMDNHGARLLEQVAALARGYGWREADVLAMSPQRRRAYLELL